MRYYGDYRLYEELKRNFNIEDLKKECERAQREIEEIKKYVQAVYEQAQIVLQATFRKEVYFYRTKDSYGKKKVYYYAGCRTLVEGHPGACIPTIGAKRFGGLEKKEAKAYAEQLAKDHNAPIVGK